MEMGVDYDRNLRGRHLQLLEPIVERGSLARPFVLQTVDVVELRVLLVARPGIDENQTIGMLDEKTSHSELNPVPLVGRNALFPERFRNDAEHRAAVELLSPRLDRVDRQVA